MPPFLPRKRLRSISPTDKHPSVVKSRKVTHEDAPNESPSTSRRSTTLFEALDSGHSKIRHSKAALERIAAVEDEDESSLSDLSDGDFEDGSITKPQSTLNDEAEDDDDDDIEFEDVSPVAVAGPSTQLPSGNLELTLIKDHRISLINQLGTRKGPTKLERQTRIATHQMHVMMLMWHNAKRNAWLCDKKLQHTLVQHVPPNVLKEVDKWRTNSGSRAELSSPKVTPGQHAKEKKTKQSNKSRNSEVRSQRDWGKPAERQALGDVDMSHGDPLFRLLKVLARFWKERFRITSPGLRKMGYMSLHRLDDEIKSFRTNCLDVERHGERIADKSELQTHAQLLEGSRDIGAQLFTALLRGLGLESRLVANLQPVGFGWNKNEDALDRKSKKRKSQDVYVVVDTDASSSDTTDNEDHRRAPRSRRITEHPLPSQGGSSPITLPASTAKKREVDDNSDSVIDVTPSRPRRLPNKPYDKDLAFPHYWTEVLSPVTGNFVAVDALVLDVVATNVELVQKFEPRGQKADKAKQVTAYIIGHSSDGTAKDVTVRYLKNHMLPGRTKGLRLPTEKIPVYKANGRIKRYDQYDWFKKVMSGYERGSKTAPRTELDDEEDATDLKIVQPKKREVKEGEETLQSYKNSQEFVLERHLKREEALLPSAKHVKTFSVKSKSENTVEEKVFLRKDVVQCKSMETWHKEGREPKYGEIPRKRVPYRAATTNRKRELAEAEHASGEKMLQGLFSRDQTDWIIPPPIVDGVIPKNNYGNMDVYVPSMVPEGAVHLPMRGTMRICKKLGIDFAEAVTGFEFGKRMAIPVITGVVIAEEHHDMVIEYWEQDEAERLRKEDEKRTKTALGAWRKMLMGMRVVQKVRDEYGGKEGDVIELPGVFKSPKKTRDGSGSAKEAHQSPYDKAGGFVVDDDSHDEEPVHNSATFFHSLGDGGGGFVVEEQAVNSVINKADADEQMLIPSIMDTEDGDYEPDVQELSPNLRREAPEPGEATEPFSTKSQSNKSLTAKRRGRPPAKARQSVSPAAREDTGTISDPCEVQFDQYSPSKPHDTRRARSARKDIEVAAPGGSKTRQTPRRNAKRQSVSGIKSKYFEHSDENEED